MKKNKVFVGWAISLVAVGVLTGCAGLPSSGPSTRKVAALGNEQVSANVPQVSVVDVNEPIVRKLYQERLAQSFAELGGGKLLQGLVGVGDVLDITIWEAPPALLFGSVLSTSGAGSGQVTKLPEQMVSAQGLISVPFVGNVKAAGKTPEQIQNVIKGKLKRMANQPQVVVRLAQNNSANVSVVRAGNSVRMPLTAGGERVLDAVAAVGGANGAVQDISVRLSRGEQVKTVAFETLVSDPRQNILLKSGDVVTLLNNPLSFTALGAVGRSQQIDFSAKGLSLAEAVGRMGGLQDRRSDARGVFVFRYQTLADLPEEEKGVWLTKGYSYDAEIPVVYRLNLTDANSLFWMQRFPVQNKDVVYVSNAPLAEVQKFLQFVFSPVVSGVSSIDNIAN
ncbi:polysaccharide biosynthesis/export family protein [Neisseria sp. 83E34]|uniref:polysaccharide biosynthesis/export family protein n=1 Tax=Neisseria sp. 83E34 TaxID=1692264 RepID=UPI0006CE8D3F|nr:polysaccharide biosynthesis/export family protein [Neisseria sp. 83E34]KPN71181.1 sugar ABC transporter substrate-binding protein [Neisseria sp. 83E34]